MNRTIAVLGLSLGLFFGCKGENISSVPAEVRVDWPARDADDAPVTVRFVRMIGDGGRRGAEIRLFNFKDIDVTRLDLRLRYIDASGNELSTYPFTTMAEPVVKAKAHKLLQVGAFVPAETAEIQAVVTSVGFGSDPTPRWVRPGETPSQIHAIQALE